MLLLDEPVTGLDPVAQNEMYNLIKLINLCDGITVIMVSHDIHEAVRYATHILHLGNRQLFFGSAADYKQSDMADGKLAEQGTPEVIFSHPQSPRLQDFLSKVL